MKNFYPFVFCGIILFIGCNSCKFKRTKDKSPDLPFLREDTLNTFKVGQKFVLLTTWNSCCKRCFVLPNSSMTDNIPQSAFYMYKETIEEPADPDCAGCSSYYYNVMECVAPGIDSLTLVSIPMGSVEEGNCEEQPKTILNQELSFIKYKILVQR